MEVTRPCGRKVLYYCPSSMPANVRSEFQRWAPHRSVMMMANQPKIVRRMLIDNLIQAAQCVVVLNYEASRKDNSLIEDLKKVGFDTIIIDEAHNIKDRSSKAFRDIFAIAHPGAAVKDWSQSIPFIIPMTGTPILNKPQEFFTMLSIVDPMHFPQSAENYFLRDYCTKDYGTGRWTFKPGGVESLFQRFNNLFLRRTKEQAGIILPPKTVTIHEIEIDEEKYPMQSKAREQMRKHASIMLDPDAGKAIVAQIKLTVYLRLRQIETWPAQIKVKDKDGNVVLELGDEYAESQKIDEVISWENGNVNEWGGLIPEITRHPVNNPDGERTVLFSQFKEPLHEVKRRLDTAGYRSVILDGDTPQELREIIRVDFDARGRGTEGWGQYDVVLCNYKVGGVGLNFTDATQMVVLDEEWNPGKRDQAYDRIHRMGQDKPVTIHVLRAKNSLDAGIDVWLAGLIEEKESMVDGFHAVGDKSSMDAFDALKAGLI